MAGLRPYYGTLSTKMRATLISDKYFQKIGGSQFLEKVKPRCPKIKINWGFHNLGFPQIINSVRDIFY